MKTIVLIFLLLNSFSSFSQNKENTLIKIQIENLACWSEYFNPGDDFVIEKSFKCDFKFRNNKSIEIPDFYFMKFDGKFSKTNFGIVESKTKLFSGVELKFEFWMNKYKYKMGCVNLTFPI